MDAGCAFNFPQLILEASAVKKKQVARRASLDCRTKQRHKVDKLEPVAYSEIDLARLSRFLKLTPSIA